MEVPKQQQFYAVLEAPSNLGLRAKGVEQLPEVLIKNGLLSRLDAKSAGRVDVQIVERNGKRDEISGVLNGRGVVSYATRLSNAIEPIIKRKEFPLVLGGDCSIVLGPALALKRQGRYGLLYIDGQADFFQVEAEPNGEAASMDLAFVTGFGPKEVTELEGIRPLVNPCDVVVFGYRDHLDQKQYGSQGLPQELLAFDLPKIREIGIAKAAHEAMAYLTGPELDGFWIHVDADCLDDALMPAVDYRLPGGLSVEDLKAVLFIAIHSGKAVGLDITVYNPTLDSNGEAGKLLTDLIVNVLRPPQA